MSRPSTTAPLDAPRIAHAALALIDAEGLGGLSMRRLGTSLNVRGMALYRHYGGKAEILDAVRRLLVEEFAERLAAAPTPEGWREHLRLFAGAYREVAQAHPKAFPLLATGAELAWEHGREIAGAVLTTLLEAGFDEDTAIGAERTVIRFVIGNSLIETATAETAVTTPPDRDDVDPTDTSMTRLVQSITATPSEGLFRLGLDFILDGLASRLPVKRR